MSLFYQVVRPLARIALKTYFRKLYLHGVEHIPADKPVILAANHPSAFLEPCLLATLLPKPLYFMVRGDFFEKPIFAFLLRSLHMIPLYRLKDIGIQGVKNNFSSLEEAYQLLKQNKQILILAEGTTRHEKRLRPIKKGAARMALGAIEKYPELDVQIVPIGVNYTDILNYRSEVMLEAGKPIAVQSFLQNKAMHPAEVIRTITRHIEEALQQQVVIIKNKEDEELTEALFALYRNNYPSPRFPVLSDNPEPLKREISIAQKVNSLVPETKSELSAKIKQYRTELSKHHLADEVIVQPHDYRPMGVIGIVFGAFPFLVGAIFNYPPIRLGKWTADTKVKKVTFYASVSASASLAIYLVYYLILFGLALFFQSLWGLIFLLMMPFLGFFALQFYEYLQRWQKGKVFYKTEDSIIMALKKQRKQILRTFESAR